MIRRFLFIALVLVLLAMYAFSTEDDVKPLGCNGNVEVGATLRGLRLFNDVGVKARVFLSPIPAGDVRDVVEGTWRVVGYWMKAFNDGINGRPKSEFYTDQEESYTARQKAHDDGCNPCLTGSAPGAPSAPPAAPPGPPVDSLSRQAPVSAVIGAQFGATGSWARYHTGTDYRAGQGTEVKVPDSGTVLFAGNSGDWAGNHVAVKHADGYTTMYSHLSTILVTRGQPVSARQVIGQVGNTGRSFGAHLHFEVYPPGVKYGNVYRAVDPQPWLKGGKPTVATSYGGFSANPSGVAEQAASLYFPVSEVPTAVAVAGAESNWRNVSGPTVGRGTMRGMWQINDGANARLFTQGKDWRKPEDNAWMAYQVWDAADGKTGNGRGSWSPWTTYTSGSYKRFVTASIQPPGQGDPTGPGAQPEQQSPDANPNGTVCGLGGLTGSVKVGTWNVLKSNSASNIGGGVRAIAGTGAAVIGFQEASSNRTKVAIRRGLGPQWGMTPGNTAVPIAWNRTQVDLVRAYRTEGVMHGQYHKWIQVAQFRTLDGAGQTFTMVNTHMLYRVEKGGKARASAGRLGAYRTHIGNILAVVKTSAAGAQPVVATADWNSDFGSGVKNGLLTPLAAAGLVSNWQAAETPTHGSRTIDGGWGMNVKFVGQTVLRKFGSDHSPVVIGLGGTGLNPDATVDGISKGKSPGRALPLAGMSRDARSVMRCTAVRFPRIETMGSRPGHMPSQSQAVDLMLSGAFKDHRSADAQAYGWRMAEWYRANAGALGITQVIYYEKIWTLKRSGEGWRTYTPLPDIKDRFGEGSMHRNHVHVSVAGSSGSATQGDTCNV